MGLTVYEEHGKRKKKKRRRLLTVIIFLLAISALLLDSRFRLVTTDYVVSYRTLPERFDGFKIVQLSDLHGTEYGENSGALLKKVSEEAPDVIAITGDLVDGDTDFNVIETLLRGLSRIAPVYYVSGNHEWASRALPELEELLKSYGVTYLQNDYVMLERGTDKIALAGVEDPNGPVDMMKPDELTELVQERENGAFTLLLAHRNDWVEKYPQLRADLILCGHAHGGIVRLPFAGGVFGTGFNLFPTYTEGEFTSGRYVMIVSRGLGGKTLVPRFLNNPELVAVTLKKE